MTPLETAPGRCVVTADRAVRIRRMTPGMPKRALTLAIGAVVLALSGCGDGGPASAPDPGTKVGFLDSGWVKFVGIGVLAVLILAAFTPGAFGKLAAVIVAAILAWVVLAPNLTPELQTPDGPWRIHLGGDKEGDDLVLVNTRCSKGGAEGTIVNLGERPVDLVLRTTYSRDEWEAERVDSGLIRVAPRVERRWTVANAPSFTEQPEASCRAAILAARRHPATPPP